MIFTPDGSIRGKIVGKKTVKMFCLQFIDWRNSEFMIKLLYMYVLKGKGDVF